MIDSGPFLWNYFQLCRWTYCRLQPCLGVYGNVNTTQQSVMTFRGGLSSEHSRYFHSSQCNGMYIYIYIYNILHKKENSLIIVKYSEPLSPYCVGDTLDSQSTPQESCFVMFCCDLILVKLIHISQDYLIGSIAWGKAILTSLCVSITLITGNITTTKQNTTEAYVYFMTYDIVYTQYPQMTLHQQYLTQWWHFGLHVLIYQQRITSPNHHRDYIIHKF